MRRLTLHDFIIYCDVITMKTVSYWYEKRHADQWNWIEHPEINWHTKWSIESSQKMPRWFNEKRKLFSKNDAGTIGYLYTKQANKKKANWNGTYT